MNVTSSHLDETVLSASEVRETYLPPRLRVLGDIREMTLGGSLGTGDSGSAGTQQF